MLLLLNETVVNRPYYDTIVLMHSENNSFNLCHYFIESYKV